MDRRQYSRQYKAPERQGEAEQAAAAMQKVADTMIAATENFRHYFHEHHGPFAQPQLPPFLHTRASSSSSVNSSKGLFSASPAMGTPSSMGSPSAPSTDGLTPPPLRPSRQQSRRRSRPRGSSAPSIPSLPELPGSLPVPRTSKQIMAEDVARGIYLSSPTLPPRLRTPATPMDWYPPTQLDYLSQVQTPSPRNELPIIFDTEQSIEPKAPHSNPLTPRGYAYTALQPDCAFEPAPPDSSSSHPLASSEIRRKPVAVPSEPSRGTNVVADRNPRVVVTVCVAHALVAGGLAQAMLPAGIIGESVSTGTSGRLSWYAAAYGLGAGAFSLPAARVAQLVGHKTVFMSGLFWLAAWSLLAGLSVYVQGGDTATAYFFLCRTMQGISLALVVSTGHVVLRRAYPPGVKDDVVMGLYGASAPVGFVLGAVVAGLFADLSSWTWAFHLTAIISAILATLSYMVLPSVSSTASWPDVAEIWAQLDGRGVVLSVSGLLLFNIGWNQVQAASWKAPYTYFLMIIGAIILVAFFYLETKAPHPLLPIRTLSATACLTLGLLAVCWAAFGIWLWYLVLFLSRTRGWGPLLSSAGLAPLAVTSAAACSASSYALEDRSRARWLLLVAAATLFAGSVFAATAPPRQAYWLNTFFGVLLAAPGVVVASPAAVVLLGDGAADAGRGVPTSLALGVSMYAMSTALGMAGAVEGGVRGAGEPEVELAGYRAAQYFGLGLAGLGLVGASVLVAVSYMRRPRKDGGELGG